MRGALSREPPPIRKLTTGIAGHVWSIEELISLLLDSEANKRGPLQEASSKCELISGNGERIEIPPSPSGNGRTKSNRYTPSLPQSCELLRKIVLNLELPQKVSEVVARSKI